jgi:hypothetical protein
VSYLLVFSKPDGSEPIASTPITGDREVIWNQFRGFLAPGIHHPYGPERLRLVDADQWPAIQAAAARRSR